jgi:tetratricopeptide (TPR) repeat protein
VFGDLLGKNLNRYRIEKQIGAGGMGVVLYDQGDLDGARKLYDQAAAIYRSIGSTAGVAAATDNAASVISDQGDLVTARKMSEEALALYREVGDQTGIGQP